MRKETGNHARKPCKSSNGIGTRRRRKVGRPKTTWRRTVTKERDKNGWRSWSDVRRAAEDRQGWFDGCLLPLSFSSESIPAEMQSRDIKVFWNDYGYSLNLQSGVWEVDSEDVVRKLCINQVVIDSDDSELLQRCTIQLLENASNYDIPITSVCLKKSFKECEEDVIVLHSGLRLNQLLTVEKIHVETEQVNKEPRILTEEDVTMIFRYGLRSELLKDLSFDGCLLPLTFSLESISAEMQSRDIKVFWNDYGYSLNLQSGVWEIKDQTSMQRLCSKAVSLKQTDSEQLQRSTMVLLKLASSHKIPITSVCLNNSFKDCEGDVIVLHSGLRLNKLLTVEKIHIETEHVNKEPRILTEEDVKMIFRYGLLSVHLKEMSFAGCTLPLSFSLEALPKGMKSRDIKVLWQPLKHELRLDISKGTWKFGNPQDSLVFRVKDETSLSQLCSETVFLDITVSKQLQMSNIVHLELAASHNIPISSVYLRFCSPRVDESGLNLILEFGLSLSILSSLQKLEIFDSNRSLTNEELAAILSYSSQCTSLKELRFWYYNLPDTIPVGSIPSSLKARNVKVWNYRFAHSRLNLLTGHWQVCDENGNLPGEEGFKDWS